MSHRGRCYSGHNSHKRAPQPPRSPRLIIYLLKALLPLLNKEIIEFIFGNSFMYINIKYSRVSEIKSTSSYDRYRPIYTVVVAGSA